MIPISLAVAYVWPMVQSGIGSLQSFLVSSGAIGVWIYTFLERILIPTGLHHFIYSPFIYGPAVAEGGIVTYWAQHLGEYSQSVKPLKELFPQGIRASRQLENLRHSGNRARFYVTASKEKKNRRRPFDSGHLNVHCGGNYRAD